MKERIINCIDESSRLIQEILKDENLLLNIEESANHTINAFRLNKKVLLCGNGGSAADAQHIAAELSGRFYKDRKPLFAEALHVNTSYLTAVSNDYGFDHVYDRMVEAAGREGDILIAISTSGNSKNVLNALKKSREIGMITIGFTGNKDSEMDNLCDSLIRIPSSNIPRIQESHILVGHIICQMIEEELF